MAFSGISWHSHCHVWYINGLQPIILAEKYALLPQPDEFLQILNVNRNHWILIWLPTSYRQCIMTVCMALQHSEWLQTSFSAKLQCKATCITIRHMDVQWQSNGHDCGLFALAHAFVVCAEMEPVTLEQFKMRIVELFTHIQLSLSCKQHHCHKFSLSYVYHLSL